MSCLLQPLLVTLSLATLALSQHYLIAPNSSLCHGNVSCFTLDQLAQTNLLTDGTNLTLIFQSGELTLTRPLSIRNFTYVQMIGQNTSVIIFHCLGLTGIDHLSIDSLTFTGHRTSNLVFLAPRVSISTVQHLTINNSYFTDFDTRSQLSTTEYGVIVKLHQTANVVIENAAFEGNNGTALSIINAGTVSIENSTFTANQGENGGAVYSNNATVVINNSIFTTNKASSMGGAIATHSAEVSISHSVLTDNSALDGGGISAEILHKLSVFNSVLTGNSASRFCGGIAASCSDERLLLVSNSRLESNNAQYGGGIYVWRCNVSITSSVLTGNVASFHGGGIYGTGIASITNSVLAGNSAGRDGGGISMDYASASITNSVLTGNTAGQSGGGISSSNAGPFYSLRVSVSNSNLTGNTAEYGGGIFLSCGSKLFVYSPVRISLNTATEGGAIYAYQSTIEFNNRGYRNMITSNFANNSGGGIHAIDSIIVLSETIVEIQSNRAKKNGGGLYLQHSILYILKHVPERSPNKLRVKLEITNNTARLGGGIYIEDNIANGATCQTVRATDEAELEYSDECFIQTNSLYGAYSTRNTVNTYITQNTASESGNAIYGGLLDTCTVNSSSELNISNGLEYIRKTVKFSSGVSSDGLLVHFCDNFPFVSSRRGKVFRISVKAIDRIGNLVNATIHSSVVTKSGVGRLKEGQTEQRVGSECTELKYNVFAEDSSAQLELYADGPYTSLEISKITFNVTFLPCTCPLGFHSSQSPIECSCECDQGLRVTKCFSEEEIFQPDINTWIGVTNFTGCNATGYLVHDCPFDYCVDTPVNISLNSFQETQCAPNRSGVLCGECDEGLSLVLATSKCKECSNIFLLLLIPFAVAGIALVVLILWLNLTIATGTIYGLVIYANILAANKAIFLPFKALNFLTVFVSWVNLDLGIETCFYDGMSSQGKVLLQLVFPAYLFLLIFLIIILSKYVNSFAKLLSNRNPVATLSTLVILSYSKLLRLIIAALQFTFLDCPDGSSKIVWLYDANVQYFSSNHTPRFVAAAIILTACVLFTTLLFFGQWFSRFSEWKIMKWTKNTKYIGFMDAFHAPFTPKHRYWVGLLLFALIAHNLAASMAPDTSVPVLSAGCIALGLIVYKSVMNRVYKNRLNNALETLFLQNIVILALGTYHLMIKSDNNGQLVLAYVSMAIAFGLFVVITCYHFYKFVIKKTKVWNNQVRPLKPGRIRFRNYQKLIEIDDNADVELPAVADIHTYEQEPREDDPDKYVTPPIIRPATRLDQLREPDLDILAPITPEDYRQATPIPQAENRPRPVCTSTIVEINQDDP